MSAVSYTFPPALRAWVKQQVRERGFRDESEFIRDLVRREKERGSERQRVEAALLEAIASGDATPFTAEDWKDIERQGLARASRKKK